MHILRRTSSTYRESQTQYDLASRNILASSKHKNFPSFGWVTKFPNHLKYFRIGAEICNTLLPGSLHSHFICIDLSYSPEMLRNLSLEQASKISSSKVSSLTKTFRLDIIKDQFLNGIVWIGILRFRWLWSRLSYWNLGYETVVYGSDHVRWRLLEKCGLDMSYLESHI